jgi:hypothetical protein
MYNIDHFRTLIGAELEALVTEIKELKERVVSLEGQVLHLETKNIGSFVKHEYIGHWNHKKIEDKTKVTCNISKPHHFINKLI